MIRMETITFGIGVRVVLLRRMPQANLRLSWSARPGITPARLERGASAVVVPPGE